MKLFKVACWSLLALGCGFGVNDAFCQYPYYPSYPRYPVIVTQPQVTGFTPFGVNTGGATIHNTAFDPYRQWSRQTGPSWNVNRPIYVNGQVAGWEQGTQWFNPVTGQVHGNTQTITPNGMGGVHTQNNVYSNRNRRP